MLGKTWACWRCARERGKSGKCICYLYFLQCYKLEKSKKHGETGKQDMRTEAQLKSDFSNTTPRAVRLESPGTWGQISANYVHVKKTPSLLCKSFHSFCTLFYSSALKHPLILDHISKTHVLSWDTFQQSAPVFPPELLKGNFAISCWKPSEIPSGALHANIGYGKNTISDLKGTKLLVV